MLKHQKMFSKLVFLLLNLHTIVLGQYPMYNYGSYYNAAPYTPCAPTQRLSNPQTCVQYMKQVMSDPNMFWFGSRLQQICDPPPADPKNFTCTAFIPIPQGAPPFSYRTLGSHMFQDQNYNASSPFLNDLQYPLTVIYTSPPEVVTSCNATARSNQMLRFDANPNMSPAGVFYYRNIPQIIAPTCTPTSLCTLIFFDVGHGNIHNIWVNWPRNSDLSDYNNPAHPNRRQINPYAWLVFQQSYEINNFTKQDRYPAFSVNIRDFMRQYSLTGPVGLTWQLIVADLYAMGLLNTRGWPGTNLCAQLLEERLQIERLTLLRDLAMVPPPELGAWLAVRYNANGNYPETWLNPVQNGLIQLQNAASAPDLFLLLKMLEADGSDYAARTYTLVLARRDFQTPAATLQYYVSPYGQQGANGSVFLHWFRINIPGQNLNEGTEVLPYLAPNTAPGQYYLLLYRQPTQITSAESALSSNCPLGQERRCRFALQRFVRDNQMTVDAMSRFRTTLTYRFPGK